MLYKTLNRPRRFRYRNGSPKQRKFADGHNAVKGKITREVATVWRSAGGNHWEATRLNHETFVSRVQRSFVTYRQPFPARFRRSEIGASASYQSPNGYGRAVRIFASVCVRGSTSKAAQYWKAALSGMKAEAMASEPTRTWRKSRKRQARHHARGSGGKLRYSRRGVRL